MMFVVTLALFSHPHTSPLPPRISAPSDRPIRKALRTQISSGLAGGEIRWTFNCKTGSRRLSKAINNGSACLVLFLSTTGSFPARRKIFPMLETILGCSKTVLNTLNHCLLRLDHSYKRHFLPSCISTNFDHV